uniref:Pre-rRNA-processing protein TSR1 n=1 Tax=Anthurium amnicola TaxID=1678845 RepID=A0A1D1Y5B3_9ARAE
MGMPRAQVNKAHKSRFASKASRHVHRISSIDKGKISKGQKNVTTGARAARIQRNKQVRDEKRASLLKGKRLSSGSFSPPRVIVLFGLSSSVDLSLLAQDLLTLSATDHTEVITNTVASPTFKLRTTVLQACHGNLLSCLEMAKVADLIAFVVSGDLLCNGCEVGLIDSFGSQCLSVLRAMGLPGTAVLIRDLPNDMKKRQELKKICSCFAASELPEDCKVYLADTKEELRKFMWLFKEQHLSPPHWRTQRPYLLSHEIDVEPDVDYPGKCSLILSGYVRAHNFSVNQLVHVSGAGDFQLSKIDILKDPFPICERRNRDFMDSDDSRGGQVMRTLLPDPMKAEPLLVENVPDPLAGEQTWPTEADMAEADAMSKDKKLKKKIVPRGTSDYQAAWIIGDMDDDDDPENSDDEFDGTVFDLERNESLEHEGYDHSDVDEEHVDMTDFEDETEPDVMMADDENWTTEQIQAEILKIKEEHAEDEEFPDEIDTPIDIPARKRFAKFRGLKSFRTSSWEPKESLPQEYARIFAFDNFRRTQKHALMKVEREQENRDEHASIGSYVRLYIKQVPKDIVTQLCIRSERLPVVACGLLQHESKLSVLHFSIKKYDLYDAPIKSKESLIFHVGFRQFIARPIFSSDNMNCDMHKMERFLHPGHFSIASVYAPISFPPLPLIVLKNREGMDPAIAAFGSLRSVDPDRIILKKIILSGYPQSVSKSKASVRFMFHNPDDVRWFKPVELWTKCGRRGRIKEPVGTHGIMKCLFNGVVQQHDTVCMSLYKRVYPKWPEKQFPILDSLHC